MLDQKLIRTDPDGVRAALARRGPGEAEKVDAFLELDARRRELQTRVETVRAERNAAARAIAEAKSAGGDATEQIARQAELKDQQAGDEAALTELEAEIADLMLRIPNTPHPSVPLGDSEEDAEVIRIHGSPPEFGFEPRDHLALAGPEGLGLIDTEAGGRVSGSRFHYLLGDLVRLEFALVQWGLEKLHRRGFTPVSPPVLVKEQAMFGTGFFPDTEQQVYSVDGDDLYLVGTAEVPLASLHGDAILPEQELPIRYVGFSSCFRREAGAAGKDTRGIFRVHQFDKLELFSYCHPDRSWDEQEALLAIEEEIARELGFHYQVVNIPAGDLGGSAARKFDLEVWLPGQGRFRELTSCSNCTDYQARRLGTRFRPAGGKPQFVHMLNGTAVTSSRTLLALIEYGQQEDGSVATPAVLHPFGAPPKLVSRNGRQGVT
ncbi:MAG: serine--tRNA ligase [Gaiellales bacterium]